MGNSKTTFEVRVEVKRGVVHYSSFLGMYVRDAITKMFHIDAKSSKQAMKIAGKYGHPLSARKPNIAKMLGNPETHKLNQRPSIYETGNPYDSVIAMDEMIWQKQQRKKRIQNREKDKENT